MITKSMQAMLERLYSDGKIESGKSYQLMPSDCRGDGYDIAMRSRCDESGDYTVDGHCMRVECVVKCGSRNWSDGIPCGYRLTCDPVSPYHLQPGERAVVIERKGNTIGNSLMIRTMASIAILRADGSRIYRGHTPYWLATTHTYASHYRSGRSRADEAAYQAEVAQLRATVDQINATATPAQCVA